jgi:hypothetical protein
MSIPFSPAAALQRKQKALADFCRSFFRCAPSPSQSPKMTEDWVKKTVSSYTVYKSWDEQPYLGLTPFSFNSRMADT